MFALNTHPEYRQALGERHACQFGPAAADQPALFFLQHPDYQVTPLTALPALAQELGVGAIEVKDEGERLGLGSFKALGGMYAVARLVLEEASRRLCRDVQAAELTTPAVRAVGATMVVACATDGNHGRSVAAGACLAGAAARIFVHQGISDARLAAIAQHGAQIVTVAGTYDDAVEAAARACAEHGWHCVSDTAWPGYQHVPLLVMQGYTLLMKEALGQLAMPPTHVFVQAGVGGLAAALAAYLSMQFGGSRPVFVVVEPARAACLLASMQAGAAVRIAPTQPTVMAMLECHTPSMVAWDILTRVADAFVTVDEDDALAVMRRLAHPLAGDPAMVAGESGGVGLAGLLLVARDAALRSAIGLDEQSRIFVVSTEGAVDCAQYEAITGLSPAQVRSSSFISTQ